MNDSLFVTMLSEHMQILSGTKEDQVSNSNWKGNIYFKPCDQTFPWYWHAVVCNLLSVMSQSACKHAEELYPAGSVNCRLRSLDVSVNKAVKKVLCAFSLPLHRNHDSFHTGGLAYAGHTYTSL